MKHRRGVNGTSWTCPRSKNDMNPYIGQFNAWKVPHVLSYYIADCYGWLLHRVFIRIYKEDRIYRVILFKHTRLITINSHSYSAWIEQYTINSHTYSAWIEQYTINSHTYSAWIEQLYTINSHTYSVWIEQYTINSHTYSAWIEQYTLTHRRDIYTLEWVWRFFRVTWINNRTHTCL